MQLNKIDLIFTINECKRNIVGEDSITRVLIIRASVNLD